MTRPIVQLDRWAIITTGSRSWHDASSVVEQPRKYPPGTIVLHGGAEGLDWIAHRVALTLDMRPLSHPYFAERGKAGGPIRNGLLAELLAAYRTFGYQTAVEVFRLRDHLNVGTDDMVARTVAKGWQPISTRGTIPGVL